MMTLSSGHPDTKIGVIDGPIDFSHPAFQGLKISTVKESQLATCKNASDIACIHGTFVIGILSSKRGLPALGICPDCQVILNPIFKRDAIHNKINNKDNGVLPSATPEELSNAIIETVDAGAKIVNLSLGLSASSLTVYDKMEQAYDYALRKGVIIVVAAGNQGIIGNTSIISHQWVIPVASCDENSRLDPMSNFGPSIGNRGLMAPGINIRSTKPGGDYSHMSGTSFAAPFVTGAIALLWSIFPKATATDLIHAVRTSPTRKSIVPSLLNVESAWNILKRTSSIK